MYPVVVISPPTRTSPVVVNASQATWALGSWRSASSRTASETWSQILSGWPSPTLSDVKTKSLRLVTERPPSKLVGAEKRRCVRRDRAGFLAFFYVVAIHLK